MEVKKGVASRLGVFIEKHGGNYFLSILVAYRLSTMLLWGEPMHVHFLVPVQLSHTLHSTFMDRYSAVGLTQARTNYS